MSNRFDRIPACDGRTDRRTGRHLPAAQSVLCIRVARLLQIGTSLPRGKLIRRSKIKGQGSRVKGQGYTTRI